MPEPHASEAKKLIAVIDLLCHQLERPASSNDLKSYFRSHPLAIPQLQQRPGQLLIKAARPYRRGTNPLQKIGLIGNQAYYAVGPGSWHKALEKHGRLQRMQAAAAWRLPEKAAPLLGTKHEQAARNALAGFALEWRKVAHEHQPLADQILEATAMAASVFQLHAPDDLISRKEAQALLLKLVAKYDGRLRAKHFNLYRPLAFLRWPHSGLFTPSGALVYLRRQIKAFACWKAGLEGHERLYLSFYDPTILR
jgi:hypothetical protein